MVGRLLNSLAASFEVRDPQTRLDARAATALVLIFVIGAAVRFWGLGAVGLHGDEKTMALPTMQLIEHGSPRMPSGMFYPRAVAQLYLMAASVETFGQSEWALRLPSAVCGVLLILLTWMAGRRFLEPAWNLALTVAVALLPELIDDAQTARMYVFLVASVAGFMALVFEWERTQRTSYLLAAIIVMLVGLQFHTLAIFAAFLVLMPGMLHGEPRRMWQGIAAFVAICAGFLVINTWISHSYPQDVAADSGPGGNGPRAALIQHISWAWLIAAAAPAALLAWYVLRRNDEAGARGMRLLSTALLAGGLLAELSLHYHIAMMLIVVALVIARREGELRIRRVSLLLAAGPVLALIQAAYLHAHAAGTARQIIGLMLGWPSVWPFIAMGDALPVAAVVAAASLCFGLWRLAHRERVPDFVLLVFLGVWWPLILIGYMRWNIPWRYAEAQLLPLLLGAFAMAQWAAPRILRIPAERLASAASPAVAAVLVCVLVTNPVRIAQAVDSGYSRHPDHKGAAEFIESLHPGPRDIIVAEDVLQQTYYLGHVDYWLVNRQVGSVYLHRVDGRWLDFYTNTPLLGTGEDLRRLLERPDRGAVYVIGSGEDQEDGRKLMRAFGIAEELRGPQFKVVFRGRDGLTEVWKADAPQAAALAAGAAGGIGGAGAAGGAAAAGAADAAGAAAAAAGAGRRP